MGKYLYVEFIDNHDVVNAIDYVGNDAGEIPKHRVVKVKLTNEQAKLLEPKHFSNRGPDMVEIIRPICIQEEGDKGKTTEEFLNEFMEEDE